MFRVPSAFTGASLTRKLALMFTGAAVLTAAVVGLLSDVIAIEAVRESLTSRLEGAAADAAGAIERHIRQLDEKVDALAEDEITSEALAALGSGWTALDPEARSAVMQRLGGEGSVHPLAHPAAEAANASLAAGQAIRYMQAHDRFDPVFRAFRNAGDYADLYLIDVEGNIVYSVGRGADFGTNLLSGPHASTGLAEVYRRVRGGAGPDVHSFSDFAAYAAADGRPSSFIAAPVMDAGGGVRGVVAARVAQVSIASIVDRIAESALGSLMHAAYVIGADGVLRTDLPGTAESESLKLSAGEVARAATDISGHGTAEVMGATGIDVVAGLAPLEFAGKRFTVVAEVSVAKLSAEMKKLQWRIAMGAAIVVLVVTIGGLLVARWFAGPIRKMTEAVERLVAGEETEVPGASRGDEIGTLARSMMAIYDAAIEAKRIRAAVDASRAALMITDADFNITYLNPALHEALIASRDYWRRHDPAINLDNIVGMSIDRFHKNPAHQRAMLASLRGSHRGQVGFDGRTFALVMALVTDGAGTHIGYVAQWDERTEALAVERQISDIIEAVAAGDFSKRLAIHSEEKFVSDVAAGMNRLCEIVDGFLAELESTLSAMADGDLTRQIATSYSGRLAEVSGAVNGTITELGRLVFDIKGTVASISASTNEISDGASQLSTRTEGQAASLEETAATMEEMAATVKSNAESASKANTLASDTAMRPAERLGSIINYASGEIRDGLISYLETEDPDFAEETKRNMFTFPDIEMRIRRQDVSAIVRTVEYQTLIKALAGAEKNAPDAKKYILSNISSRMAEAIGQEIRDAGVVRRKDADAAQSEVIKVIRQLEQSGEITLVKDEEE